MRCEDCQDALSARLDGEALPDGLSDRAVDQHVAGCAACAGYAAGIGAQHRALRVRMAEPVPDLTDAILAALPAAARPQPVRVWARYALFVVALTELVLAAPALLWGDDPDASVHVARELGSFDVALAVGLLWAAWQPRRAAGLLPMAVALAGGVVLSSALDIAGGRAPAGGEAHHVLDLAGVAILWLLTRPARRGQPPAGALAPA